MPHADAQSLRAAVAGSSSSGFLHAAATSVALAALDGGSILSAPVEVLRGRSVLLTVEQQLTAALALIELDGIARRVVLCPADLAPEHLPIVAATAEAEAVVADRPVVGLSGVVRFIEARSAAIEPCPVAPPARSERTQWVLLTSGTTGVPKLVVHTLDTLTGAIRTGASLGSAAVWSTFYDMRRYGGLQIFLRAVLGGGSLVLSEAQEPVADFLARAGRHRVTHISGTPSHWRRALMSPSVHQMAPRYVRLSGEITDQGILDHLRTVFPKADIAHAFASTEAGVAFDVGDGLAGFPASLIGKIPTGVEMRVADGSLRIRSNRNALGYLGPDAPALHGADGFVDTGDMVELHDGRYRFVGRRGGVVNIGGAKVHPEEVESVINRHPRVLMSLVRARRSPITGAIVVADVVVKLASGDPRAADAKTIKGEILDICRNSLARHKVPADIRLVPALDVSAAGKLARAPR